MFAVQVTKGKVNGKTHVLAHFTTSDGGIGTLSFTTDNPNRVDERVRAAVMALGVRDAYDVNQLGLALETAARQAMAHDFR